MITNIYKNESELCVDICEILYKILNQFYKFDKVIKLYNEQDIAKISDIRDFKQTLYIDISNYTNNTLNLLKRLNLEVFINLNLTVVTIVQVSILESIRKLNMNVEVEYVPQVLECADTEIELEQELAIITFNPNSNRGEEYEC